MASMLLPVLAAAVVLVASAARIEVVVNPTTVAPQSVTKPAAIVLLPQAGASPTPNTEATKSQPPPDVTKSPNPVQVTKQPHPDSSSPPHPPVYPDFKHQNLWKYWKNWNDWDEDSSEENSNPYKGGKFQYVNPPKYYYYRYGRQLKPTAGNPVKPLPEEPGHHGHKFGQNGKQHHGPPHPLHHGGPHHDGPHQPPTGEPATTEKPQQKRHFGKHPQHGVPPPYGPVPPHGSFPPPPEGFKFPHPHGSPPPFPEGSLPPHLEGSFSPPPEGSLPLHGFPGHPGRHHKSHHGHHPDGHHQQPTGEPAPTEGSRQRRQFKNKQPLPFPPPHGSFPSHPHGSISPPPEGFDAHHPHGFISPPPEGFDAHHQPHHPDGHHQHPTGEPAPTVESRQRRQFKNKQPPAFPPPHGSFPPHPHGSFSPPPEGFDGHHPHGSFSPPPEGFDGHHPHGSFSPPPEGSWPGFSGPSHQGRFHPPPSRYAVKVADEKSDENSDENSDEKK